MDKIIMNRRFSTILFALLLAIPSYADIVSSGQARKAASEFMKKNTEPKELKLTASRVLSPLGTITTEAPAYHIFNYPDGGWVIIAGDDCLSPVLGYSRTGSFQGGNLPDNIQYWMDGIGEVVDYVRANNMKPTTDVIRLWKFMEYGTKAETGEEKILKTAPWAQERPFNDKCPIVDGESARSVTGCVATAMAILLRYHEYPEHGTGTIGGYTTETSKTNIPQYSIEDHYYNWSEMPLTPYGNGGSWSVNQGNEVAQLLHDLGVAVKMDYSSAGSGANSAMVPYVLSTYFGYSKAMKHISRGTVTKEEWFSMIRQEIKNGNPIPYAGHDTRNGGHHFICDGYNTDGNMIHINWGWGGSNNGFYTLDLNVPGQFKFSSLQAATFGAIPDPEGKGVEPEPTVFVRYLDNYPEYYGMVHATPDGIRKGAQIQFILGPIQSYSFNGFQTNIKVSLMDKDGNHKVDVGGPSQMDLQPDMLYFADGLQGTIPVEPDLTDYFEPFYQKVDGSWAPIPYDMDVFGESSVKCGVTFQPFIMIPEDIRPGDQLELKLSYASTPVRNITWYLGDERITESTVTVPTESMALKAVLIYHDNTKGTVMATIGGE